MKTLSPIPKKPLKIGLVQMTSDDDVMANVIRARQSLEKLRSEKCDLICFPENALFLRMDKLSKKSSDLNLREPFWDEFQIYANRENCVLLFGSIAYKKSEKPKRDGGHSTKDEASGGLPKIHLFDVDVKGAPPARESDFFSHGKAPAMIVIKGWNVGLSICYDLRFSELYSAYAKRNAHLMLVPAAFLVPTGKAHWHILLRARAIESQAYVAAPAQCGGHQNSRGKTRETFGHSLVVGPWGDVLLDMGGARADVAAVTLVPEELKKVREQIPMEQHRRL